MFIPLAKALGPEGQHQFSCCHQNLFHFLLTEITFSFCRLFEKRPAQFLPEMVAAMKGNSTLKGLRLPGNRLGGGRALRRERGKEPVL